MPFLARFPTIVSYHFSFDFSEELCLTEQTLFRNDYISRPRLAIFKLMAVIILNLNAKLR